MDEKVAVLEKRFDTLFQVIGTPSGELPASQTQVQRLESIIQEQQNVLKSLQSEQKIWKEDLPLFLDALHGKCLQQRGAKAHEATILQSFISAEFAARTLQFQNEMKDQIQKSIPTKILQDLERKFLSRSPQQEDLQTLSGRLHLLEATLANQKQLEKQERSRTSSIDQDPTPSALWQEELTYLKQQVSHLETNLITEVQKAYKTTFKPGELAAPLQRLQTTVSLLQADVAQLKSVDGQKLAETLLKTATANLKEDFEKQIAGRATTEQLEKFTSDIQRIESFSKDAQTTVHHLKTQLETTEKDLERRFSDDTWQALEKQLTKTLAENQKRITHGWEITMRGMTNDMNTKITNFEKQGKQLDTEIRSQQSPEMLSQHLEKIQSALRESQFKQVERIEASLTEQVRPQEELAKEAHKQVLELSSEVRAELSEANLKSKQAAQEEKLEEFRTFAQSFQTRLDGAEKRQKQWAQTLESNTATIQNEVAQVQKEITASRSEFQAIRAEARDSLDQWSQQRQKAWDNRVAGFLGDVANLQDKIYLMDGQIQKLGQTEQQAEQQLKKRTDEIIAETQKKVETWQKTNEEFWVQRIADLRTTISQELREALQKEVVAANSEIDSLRQTLVGWEKELKRQISENEVREKQFEFQKATELKIERSQLQMAATTTGMLNTFREELKTSIGKLESQEQVFKQYPSPEQLDTQFKRAQQQIRTALETTWSRQRDQIIGKWFSDTTGNLRTIVKQSQEKIFNLTDSTEKRLAETQEALVSQIRETTAEQRAEKAKYNETLETLKASVEEGLKLTTTGFDKQSDLLRRKVENFLDEKSEKLRVLQDSVATNKEQLVDALLEFKGNREKQIQELHDTVKNTIDLSRTQLVTRIQGELAAQKVQQISFANSTAQKVNELRSKLESEVNSTHERMAQKAENFLGPKLELFQNQTIQKVTPEIEKFLEKQRETIENRYTQEWESFLTKNKQEIRHSLESQMRIAERQYPPKKLHEEMARFSAEQNQLNDSLKNTLETVRSALEREIQTTQTRLQKQTENQVNEELNTVISQIKRKVVSELNDFTKKQESIIIKLQKNDFSALLNESSMMIQNLFQKKTYDFDVQQDEKNKHQNRRFETLVEDIQKHQKNESSALMNKSKEMIQNLVLNKMTDLNTQYEDKVQQQNIQQKSLVERLETIQKEKAEVMNALKKNTDFLERKITENDKNHKQKRDEFVKQQQSILNEIQQKISNLSETGKHIIKNSTLNISNIQQDSLTKCFQTALIGQKGKANDTLVDVPLIDGWDQICFTNLEIDEVPKGWRIVKVNAPESAHPAQISKTIKWQSYKYLSDQDVVVWVDAQMSPSVIAEDQMKKILPQMIQNQISILHRPHTERKCIQDECDAVLESRRDTPEHVEAVRDLLKKIKMPTQWGLFDTNCMVRFHKNPEVQAIGDMMGSQLGKVTIRDQLLVTLVQQMRGFQEFRQDSTLGSVIQKIGNHMRETF